MASLGNASLKTSVDQSGLTSGLTQASSKMQSWASSASSMLKGAFVVGAVAAGVSAAVGLVTNGFERLNEIRQSTRTATSLGIDPAQFQGLSLLLKRAGIEASQVGDFFGSMSSKIERAAATGAGPAARAFAALGLDLQSVRSLPMDQQFISIAEALSKLPAGAQQASIAMQLFGSTAMLPQLQRGRAGIEEFIAAARASGQILSGEQARAAAEAAQAWESAKRSLTQAWDSISTTIAVSLAPLVEKAAEVFTKIVEVAKPIIESLKGIFEDIGDVASACWQVIGEAIMAVWETVRGLIGSFGGLSESMPSFRDILVTTFRAIYVAVAYVWDTVKAFVGSLVYAYGVLTGNRAAEEWGRRAVTSFGSAAARVNQIFDGIGQRQRRVVQEAAQVAAQVTAAVEPALASIDIKTQNKAIVQGSNEAAVLQAQWATAGNIARQNNLGQQQLDQLRAINQRLGQRQNNRREAEHEEI